MIANADPYRACNRLLTCTRLLSNSFELLIARSISMPANLADCYNAGHTYLEMQLLHIMAVLVHQWKSVAEPGLTKVLCWTHLAFQAACR